MGAGEFRPWVNINLAHRIPSEQRGQDLAFGLTRISKHRLEQAVRCVELEEREALLRAHELELARSYGFKLDRHAAAHPWPETHAADVGEPARASQPLAQ